MSNQHGIISQDQWDNLSADKTLEQLADRLRRVTEAALEERDLAVSHATRAMNHALEAGGLLLEAKKLVPHGQWLPWLEANTPIPTSTANDWMRLARNSRRIGNLGVGQALKLIAAEHKDRPVNKQQQQQKISYVKDPDYSEEED